MPLILVRLPTHCKPRTTLMKPSEHNPVMVLRMEELSRTTDTLRSNFTTPRNKKPRQPSRTSRMPSPMSLSLDSELRSRRIPTPGIHSKTPSLVSSPLLLRQQKLSRQLKRTRMPPFLHARSKPTTNTELSSSPRWSNVLLISRQSRNSSRPR